MIAAAAMAASYLSVIGNANRLRRYHPPTSIPGIPPSARHHAATNAPHPATSRPANPVAVPATPQR